MSTSVVLSGVTFTDTDFAAFGFQTSVTVNGVAYPRWQALFVAAMSDAGKALTTTSATSKSAAQTGSQSWVLAADVPFAVGSFVTIARTSAPTTVWYLIQTTGYVSGTLTLTGTVITSAGAAGPFTDWTVQISGPQGATGATGSTGSAGSNGADGATLAANQAAVDAATSTTTAVPPAYLMGASYLNARNYACNPEGLIWQRNNAASATDNAYYWDRVRVLTDGADVVTPSQLTSGLPTGCQNAMRLTVGTTNNKKFGWWQPIQGVDVVALRGKTVCLSAEIQATTGITDARMALVEFTGTMNAVSGDPISAWNAMATVPTLAANYAYISTGAAPANLTVGTAFARFNVTASVGATATNLAWFVWSEDTTTTTTTDKLDVTKLMLTLGGAPPSYSPRAYVDELALCQLRCRVIDCSVDGAQGPIGSGTAEGATISYAFIPLSPPMADIPTFSVSAGSHFEVICGGSTIPCTAINTYVNRRTGLTVKPLTAGGMTAGHGIILEGASSSGKLTIVAEL